MVESDFSESLRALREPFAADDIEWRVSRSGMTGKGQPFCLVLAYITARAIANRLDDVVGPENWCNTRMRLTEVRTGKAAIEVGISIRIGEKWVTKYDVSEPTDIEPAKGGFSGAMKRAGAQWGIGRYLYLLDETFAEVSETGGPGWVYARLSDKHGGGVFYWKPPQLPGWALPKEKEHEVSQEQLNELKAAWKKKFAAKVKSPAELKSGFDQFVKSEVGPFPLHDHTCWVLASWQTCMDRVKAHVAGSTTTSDVPFE